MFVVLDTSILVRDFLLRGKAFQILLGSLSSIPARLCVPEIVIDEAVTKYSESLREQTQNAKTARRRVNKLLLSPPTSAHAEIDELDEDAASQAYEEHLRSRFTDSGAKLLPYPNEPHKRVVRHSLLRRKPFNKKGQGYRDYLIWISLRTEMYYAPEESVVLVTGNHADFCDGTDLAASLADEASRYHRPGISIAVCSSLDEFNSKYVVPRLELQNSLREALATDTGSGFDLHAWVVANLQDLLRDEEYIIKATHGLEQQHASCYVSAVDTIGDVQVTELRTISTQKRLISARAKVAVVLTLDVDWEQYSEYYESRDLLGCDLGESESASWNEPADLTVHFSVVVDLEEPEDASGEIDAIEGPCTTIEINELPRSHHT